MPSMSLTFQVLKWIYNNMFCFVYLIVITLTAIFVFYLNKTTHIEFLFIFCLEENWCSQTKADYNRQYCFYHKTRPDVFISYLTSIVLKKIELHLISSSVLMGIDHFVNFVFWFSNYYSLTPAIIPPQRGLGVYWFLSVVCKLYRVRCRTFLS